MESISVGEGVNMYGQKGGYMKNKLIGDNGTFLRPCARCWCTIAKKS